MTQAAAERDERGDPDEQDAPADPAQGAVAYAAIKRSRRVPALILHAPEWFARADFLAWRNREDGPAHWNSTANPDVFMTFDAGSGPEDWEGSDSEWLPRDIYAAIGRVLYEQGYRHPAHGILWIQPV